MVSLLIALLNRVLASWSLRALAGCMLRMTDGKP